MNPSVFIALAWPETYVKQVGVWYDVPMKWLNINKNGKYKVGHAAFLLVNGRNGEIHYYDFGRYHTPKKHGRVRNHETDPELQFPFFAEYKKNKLENLEKILLHISKNKSTHGKGTMYAGVYYGIDFEKCASKAHHWQKKDAIPYGPFDKKGTNCSRFVASVARSGITRINTKILLHFPITVSPTPIYNVLFINNIGGYYKANGKEISFIPFKFPFIKKQPNVIIN